MSRFSLICLTRQMEVGDQYDPATESGRTLPVTVPSADCMPLTTNDGMARSP